VAEVLALDERHREAAPRRVARDARAVDAAPDDEEVELALGEGARVAAPGSGGHGRG
jgi:hypothetical protein